MLTREEAIPCLYANRCDHATGYLCHICRAEIAELLKQQPKQPRRKAIHSSQIAASDGYGNEYIQIITTCNDGSQWYSSYKNDGWKELLPIPQDDNDA